MSASENHNNLAKQTSFSVLMSVYERDDPIIFDRALSSVFANSLLPEKTIVVVDGPLTMELDAVLDRHQDDHPTLTIHRLAENRGLATALNEGLRLVETPWVARADADDYNYPNRFEKQCAALIAHNGSVDIIGSAIREVHPDGYAMALRRTVSGNKQIRKFAARRNPFNHMTVFYRTSLVRLVGGYPSINQKEDYALWASLIQAGARCDNLEEVLVDATTGERMYQRRGGLRYALSEIALQKHLVRKGLKSAPLAVFDGFARAIVFIMPSMLRAIVYRLTVRTNSVGRTLDWQNRNSSPK